LGTTSQNLHDLKARELFAAAIDRPADQRDSYIDSACADDLALRDHVADLLQAHDRAGEFLAGATVHDLPFPAEVQAPAERPGARIGPYTLLKYLGEGGFGTVYLAQQEHPVRRTVALKIIKPGMDTRQVIARFDAERQALAMMDHPNIARVLDAGATETGRPFFVMEAVQGVPITKFCDQQKLSTRQRLDLFVQVCRAVQHAHTKGIIHRDIKPSNILVAQADGDAAPLPKVIDFGIAKATHQRLTEHTYLTDARQMIGTPEYMSPEQADGAGIDVDTRSDVYSLGVLLYELLTGTTPFDAKELRNKAFAEMQRIIREVDPPKPSTRLSTLGDTLATVATDRAAPPNRISQIVRGELDWIVMRALEKERTRRYETASDLASDVERYLRDELVQARPPSRAYLFRKLLRRHRVAVGAGSAIAAAIFVGMALALWGLHRANQERDNALESKASETRQLNIANAARARAKQVNDLMRELHVAANRRRTGSEGGLRAALAEQAAKLETGILDDQPDIEAAFRASLGNIYASNAMWDEAEQQHQRALNLRKRIHPPTGHPDLADSLNDLGWVLHSKGEHERAESLLWQALKMRQNFLGSGNPVIAANLYSLGTVIRSQKRIEDASNLFRQSLQVRINGYDKRIADQPKNPDLYANRAHLRARRGDFDKAILDYTLALDLDPSQHWWWFQRVALNLYMSDRAAYEQDCREMYDRFGNSPFPEVIDRASKASLLVPDTPIDLVQLRKTIDPQKRPANTVYLGWMRITKGMLEYRCGNYEQALYWLQRGRDSNIHSSGMLLADYFAAMALYRQGQVEPARNLLRKAISGTPPDTFALTDRDPIEAGSAVHGWLINQIIRREAEALIKLNVVATTAPTTLPAQSPQPIPIEASPDDDPEPLDAPDKD
jgi:serine/threonine protein kinase/Flp pilus assembly protein TadD